MDKIDICDLCKKNKFHFPEDEVKYCLVDKTGDSIYLCETHFKTVQRMMEHDKTISIMEL